MLETPSLAWQVSAVCDHADFVSVGANDLMQFFFWASESGAIETGCGRISQRNYAAYECGISSVFLA